MTKKVTKVDPKTMKLVLQHYDGNRGKANLWFRISNPMLGGISPMDMILMGRGEKLHRIVEQARGTSSSRTKASK